LTVILQSLQGFYAVSCLLEERFNWSLLMWYIYGTWGTISCRQ